MGGVQIGEGQGRAGQLGGKEGIWRSRVSSWIGACHSCHTHPSLTELVLISSTLHLKQDSSKLHIKVFSLPRKLYYLVFHEHTIVLSCLCVCVHSPLHLSLLKCYLNFEIHIWCYVSQKPSNSLWSVILSFECP